MTDIPQSKNSVIVTEFFALVQAKVKYHPCYGWYFTVIWDYGKYHIRARVYGL